MVGLRIGVLGYFGLGNFGDELFLERWRQLFADQEVVTFHDVTGVLKPMHSSPEQRAAFASSVDCIVIGGGDLIRPSAERVNYWYDEFLSVPVFLFGLGAATWIGKSMTNVNAFRDFALHENVRMIAMRDLESLRYVDTVLGVKKAVVCPDIVWSMQSKIAIPAEQPKAVKRVGIVRRHMRGADKSVAICDRIQNVYPSTDGWEFVEIIASTGQELEWDMEAFGQAAQNQHQVIVPETTADICRAVGTCDVLYSMKFHTSVVGLIHHVPTVNIIRTDKFTNLYRFLALGAWNIGQHPDKLNHIDHKPPRKELWDRVDTLCAMSEFSLQSLRRMVLDCR